MRDYPTCIDCKKQLSDYRAKRCKPCNGLNIRIPLQDRFWKYVKKTDHCWIWTGSKRAGRYGSIFYRETHRYEAAHRISWIIRNGKIPKGMCILHDCRPLRDNPLCINPDHLWIGTQAQNINDSVKKKTKAIGVRCWSAKLTEKDVLSIREEIKKHHQGFLAKKYGVGKTTINYIVNKVTWKHI